MRTKAGFAVLLCLFGILSYGSYRKGYSDATSRAAVEHVAEYGNDSNGDPSVKHSASYEIGYARGHGAGWAETRQKDFVECGEKLAHVAVEAGNPKIAAGLLVEGYVAQSQIESAVENQRNQPAK